MEYCSVRVRQITEKIHNEFRFTGAADRSIFKRLMDQQPVLLVVDRDNSSG